MSRLASIFADLSARKAKALMPFVCGAYPSPGVTAGVLLALERAGASVVEVGYPFSDPIADGPVIAAAMHEALQRGATPGGVTSEIASARSAGLKIGVVAMVSVSIVHRLGPTAYFASLRAAGVDGVILPDVVLEDAGAWIAGARDAGLTVTLLVAPTTDVERAAKIAAACSGFVYMLARAGITGESASIATDALRERIQRLRGVCDLPIAVGFGVSNAAQVRQIVHECDADAAIVGSALVRRMSDAQAAGADPIAAAEMFTRELASGLV